MKKESLLWSLFWSLFWIFYVVVVAVVVVIVDVDVDALHDVCFFGTHVARPLHPHRGYKSSCCVSTTEVVCTQMHFRDDSELS